MDLLKNIVQTVLAPGGVNTVAHGLNVKGVGMVPDIAAPDTGGIVVTSDDTELTVTNNTGAPVTVRIFVWSWHSYERVLGAKQTTTLTPQPFLFQGANTTTTGTTLNQAYKNGPAAAQQAILIDIVRGEIQVRDVAAASGQTLFQVSDNTGALSYFRVDGEGVIAGQRFVYSNQGVSIAAPASSGGLGGLFALQVAGGAHTGLSASTENTQVNFDLAQTRQWAAGDILNQRTMRIQAETIDIAGGVSGVFEASTVAISGPPIMGPNVAGALTLWAFKVESGNVYHAGEDTFFGVDFDGEVGGRVSYSAGTFQFVGTGHRNAFGDGAHLSVLAASGDPNIAGSYGGVVLLRSGFGMPADAADPGGTSGSLTIEVGVSGVASATQVAGNVGNLTIQGGTGGAGAAANSGATGGNVVILAGGGGAPGATSTGAAGGTLQITGGPASNGTAAGVGGAGGPVQIAGGIGGPDGGGGAGVGGDVTIDGGASGGAGAVAGSVVIHGGVGVGAAEGGHVILRTNAITRIDVGIDAEAANETAVYIRVNNVMKRIHADTIANVTAAAGLALYVDP